jgi:hypothetical protein
MTLTAVKQANQARQNKLTITMESEKTKKQPKTTDNELEDKLGELNFIRARKRRESAAIFNKLNEGYILYI